MPSVSISVFKKNSEVLVRQGFQPHHPHRSTRIEAAHAARCSSSKGECARCRVPLQKAKTKKIKKWLDGQPAPSWRKDPYDAPRLNGGKWYGSYE